MLELNLIMLFVIIAAFIAVEMKDLLSAVVSVAAAGLGLCIMFLILKAPDIAIITNSIIRLSSSILPDHL